VGTQYHCYWIYSSGIGIYTSEFTKIFDCGGDEVLYRSERGLAEVDHVREARNYVHSEGDEQAAHHGVDGAEEGKGDGEEPDGQQDGHSAGRPKQHVIGLVHPQDLLPHEVQRRHRKPHRDKLQEHTPTRTQINLSQFTQTSETTSESILHPCHTIIDSSTLITHSPYVSLFEPQTVRLKRSMCRIKDLPCKPSIL